MFSKKVVFLSMVMLLLIPSLSFSQHYVSDKCPTQKHNSYEFTLTTNYSAFDYRVTGHQLSWPITNCRHPHFSSIGIDPLRHGNGSMWSLNSELLIPVNWGIMSHVIVGLDYYTLDSDLFIRPYDMESDGTNFKFGFKLRF
jgi:hypothetical protein